MLSEGFRNDIMQIAYGYGFHYVAEKVEAIVLPISAGNTDTKLRMGIFVRNLGARKLVRSYHHYGR